MNLFVKQPVFARISQFGKRFSSELLHQSRLQTYHFQECLPRLPIPKLEDTLHKYLVSLKALEGHPDVTRESITDTERAIKNFLTNDGPILHKLLVERNTQNPQTSYISKPWFDMYLESRLPLPLNYNPFLLFKRDPNEEMNDQATRSTNILVAAMRFQKTLNAKVLTPEVFYTKDTAKSASVQTLVKYLPNAMKLRYIPMMMGGAYPLDMSQFKNLLNSTRIPIKGKDELKVYPGSRHVVVIRNGYFYKVNTLDMQGNVLDPKVIKASLDRILADKRPRNEDSIAYLTSTERNTWADARNHLLSEAGNIKALADVDSAIFCLVLDDAKDTGTSEGAVRNCLYGDGASRWFDKSFSIIVSEDGEAALNFEHAWGDGVAVMRLFNEVFDASTLQPAIACDLDTEGLETLKNFEEIEFHVDDHTKQEISLARNRYEQDTGRLRIASCEVSNLNKDYLKKKKVSPDGILQLAIQIGHYKLCGHPAATYESCSTSAFKHGRTETIRSCTLEAQEAARAVAAGTASTVNNKLANDEDYRAKVEELIRKSCNKHNAITRDAAMGQGFDRHLFALKHTAERQLGAPTPAFFRDPSYQTMNHIVLSTSTLASHAVAYGGFAPVVPDGFGVGYGVRDEGVGCNITSYVTRDVSALVEAIKSSLMDLHTVLEGSKSS